MMTGTRLVQRGRFAQRALRCAKCNIPPIKTATLKDEDQDTKYHVLTQDFASYTFVVKFGVRQGSFLSPFLFAIYLDDIPVNRSLIPS